MAKPARHILLVEDDFAIRETVAEILEAEGFHVTCARNGADALERLSQRAGRPGLILLDLMMPVMDGVEFRRAQALDPELATIPVVVLSASASHDFRVLNLLPGAYLTKPFELERLLATVERLYLDA
jgi:CheY-like chemotaxis protein